MRYHRRPDVEITQVDSDGFLVDPKSGEVFHLDPTACGLWTLLAEPMDEDGIAIVFRSAFPEAPPETMAQDLRQALRRLVDHGLVVTVP